MSSHHRRSLPFLRTEARSRLSSSNSKSANPGMGVNRAKIALKEHVRRRRSFFRARTVATVYEPTYKLQPDEKPNLEVIRFVLSSVLKNAPSAIDNSAVAKITSEIHDRVKLMMPKRYRFIVQTFQIGNPSDSKLASRSLWDSLTDMSVSVTQKIPHNGNFIAVVHF